MAIIWLRPAGVLAGALIALVTPLAARPQPLPASKGTKVVLLGTGTPAANPDRSGPATAIVVNDTAYLVDFGPGVVRRASAAASKGITALQPTALRVAFVTHLHSDHTVGYPDLIFTPWTLGRRVPLEVYGPRGLGAMTTHLLEAYRVDIETRTNADGNQRTFADGHKVNAHEIAAGVVYKDSNVTVTAFPSKHAMESYGYRFDTADRSIVISGDTAMSDAIVGLAKGADVLVHEAIYPDAVDRLAARVPTAATLKKHLLVSHTTAEDCGRVAAAAGVKTLVLSHFVPADDPLVREQAWIDAARKHYSGRIIFGRDLLEIV